MHAFANQNPEFFSDWCKLLGLWWVYSVYSIAVAYPRIEFLYTE